MEQQETAVQKYRLLSGRYRKALEFYASASRLMLDITDSRFLMDGEVSKSVMDNGDVAREALKEITWNNKKRQQ